MNINPYQTPLADDQTDISDFESERLVYRQHECWLRMFGFCYYYASHVSYAFAGLAVLFAVKSLLTEWSPGLQILVPALLVCGASYLGTYAGVAMAFPDSTKYRLILISGLIWFLLFPVGTVTSSMLFWLLLSPKGRHIFTPEYETCVE